jgi:hypothetical protein
MYKSTHGYRNTVIGSSALLNNLTGHSNIAIGYRAGYAELGSNKLYVDNSSTITPLIGGDFSTNALTTRGNKIWHEGNDGASSTLDADLLDGNHASAFALAAAGVTNGNTHDHNGGDGAQIDHVNLANKGTNTHAQIDTHLAAANPHSGYKPHTLDHGSKSANFTIDLSLGEMHLIAFTAAATLTIMSSSTNDKAMVIIKNGGYAITLAGIDNDSPTLTNGASKQDFLGLTKSFGKISCVATQLNKATS